MFSTQEFPPPPDMPVGEAPPEEASVCSNHCSFCDQSLQPQVRTPNIKQASRKLGRLSTGAWRGECPISTRDRTGEGGEFATIGELYFLGLGLWQGPKDVLVRKLSGSSWHSVVRSPASGWLHYASTADHHTDKCMHALAPNNPLTDSPTHPRTHRHQLQEPCSPMIR